MASKIYNTTKVESVKASVGDDRTSGLFSYKGFNSRNIKQKFKIYDTSLIKQDLLNHFNIKQGEKLENPEYGTIIWSMIYEPMTDANLERIREDVVRIVQSEPRASIDNITINPTEQGVRIEIGLSYLDVDLSEVLYFNFTRDNVPNGSSR